MKRAEPRWLFVGALVLTGCTRAETPSTGSSESHFLVACDEACADGLECLCGVCSAPCDDDRQCRGLPGPASCEAPAAAAGACEGDSEIRVCDATCGSDDDCGALEGEAACVSGRCRYAERPADACLQDGTDSPPQELACTGLYADIATKQLSPGVEPFAPALELWSGGAETQRFVYLPPDTRIDASEPDDWRFPVGTKLFQQFRVLGQRAETRMFWKVSEERWVKAAYLWANDETGATRFGGGEVTVAGTNYYIPTAVECDQCHGGRSDHALGFQAALLGLPAASGQTLEVLAAAGRLENHAMQTMLSFGDDGTGLGAQAMGWLHVHCGVSCHNGNPAAEGFARDLSLQIRAAQLDGRSSVEFDARITTVDVEPQVLRWQGRKRVVAGTPNDSLLYEMLTMSGAHSGRSLALPESQFDPVGVALIAQWIESMAER